MAEAEAAPARASVPAVAALAECQEVGARELADLVLVAGRVQRVSQEAFGKVAVAVLAPEEDWEPAAPRAEAPGAVLAADQVRGREDPEDPEVAAAPLVRAEESALVAVAGRGLAAVPAPVGELVAGKPLEGG